MTLQEPLEIWGKDVGIKLTPHNGELVETLMARDGKGKVHAILKTPTAPGLPLERRDEGPTALKGANDGNLFREAPTLRFTKVEQAPAPGGTKVVLARSADGVTLRKELLIPAEGNTVSMTLSADFTEKRPSIEYFLLTYAFTPDAKPMSKGGKPHSTFSPGLRPKDNQVVGDHFFRAPAIVAQKGSLAALILPDVDHLGENRPMPTILDLDAKNGVADAALMSYGFCDHKVVGHVYYAHDASMIRRVPKHLELKADVILAADAPAFGAYQIAARETWNVGSKYFDKVLPQAMPFEDYAKVCYPAAFNEAYGTNKLGWFEVEIDGVVCGGIPSGWGFQQGWVSWQCWFNQLRSAWGLRWWGKKTGNAEWVDKADKMLNLALAAPMDEGLCPTTYQSREKTWLGSLIRPRADCYYDLTNMAWKGIWLLRWLEFEDCPRREEIRAQCEQMAEAMMKRQNANGSFPTWLTKEKQVVPILDHSAQSALPAWFLAALVDARLMSDLSRNASLRENDDQKSARARRRAGQRNAALRACDFLVNNVVDQQRWYDFETFFSCSPKVCKQMNGKIDDVTMHDPHTLSPPQNTLCMEWTANALFKTSTLFGRVSSSSPRLRYARSATKALDILALYQNVWPISYRKTAYTYGGFGVQNSDGEYDDARQAQFGCTLADFGAALGRKDYFERGVAATRASMALINHPLHIELGIYPNPNYPLGLQPENCCHGGGDHQAGRTGFDWGEGSGLASMAWLMHKYGETYNGKGWSVLVDGGGKGAEIARAAMKPLVDPTFTFGDWRMKGWTVIGNFAETPTFSDRMDFGVNPDEGFIGTCEDGKGGWDDTFTGTVTSPEFTVTRATMKLYVGGGSGDGVKVELLDADGKAIYTERGRNRERMDVRTWDMSALAGKKLRIRATDNETGGWGHINLGKVWCE